MQHFLTLTAALTARLLATVASVFSSWLFERLLEGATLGYDLLAEGWEFSRYLAQALAQQVCGTSY